MIALIFLFHIYLYQEAALKDGTAISSGQAPYSGDGLPCPSMIFSRRSM